MRSGENGGPGRARGRRRRADKTVCAEGFVLGALCGLAAYQLGVLELVRCSDVCLGAAIAGLALAAIGARALIRAFSVLAVCCLLIVGYTPLVGVLLARISRSDPLPVSSPAVVVLSSNSQTDGSLSASAQERLMQGYVLLQQRRANTLVLTNAEVPHGSQAPACQRQIRELGFTFPVLETGKVRNTHDEALAVAAMARREGWSHVILVTHPWHMRRAAAVFRKAGVRVFCSPCAESEYDHLDLNPDGRLRAFSHWLHETVGYAMYQRRGWI